MTEKLPDVWTSRDYPVLAAAAKRFDEGETSIRVETLATDTGLSVEDVKRAGSALSRRDLLTASGAWGDPIQRVSELSGEAYLLTGLHPDGDDAVTRLVDALRQAADQTNDPEEKSKLRRLADNAGGVSRDVLAAVLATVITGGLAS